MNTPFIWRIVLVLVALLVCVLLALWLPSVLSSMPTEAQQPPADQRRKKPPLEQRKKKPPPDYRHKSPSSDQRPSEGPQRETGRFRGELDALRKQHAELEERYDREVSAARAENLKLAEENRILTAELEQLKKGIDELAKSRLQAMAALNTSEQVQKHLATQLSQQVAGLKKMLETLLSEQEKGATPTPPGEDPFAPRPR